jgi:hypothetical protein
MAYPANLAIFYEGNKKIIKISSPNALLQTVLLEAAQQFGLDPTRCTLRVKKTTLDCSQPIRFCNLSNNAQIEMVLRTSGGFAASSLASSALCKIALSAPNGASMQSDFPGSTSLLDIIVFFMNRSSLPADVLYRSPQIVFLRSAYNAAALQGTTLASLGLAG